MWEQMRSLLSRISDWVVVHPVLWGVGSAVVLNVLHAKRRGYCPLPAEPGSHPIRAEAE
jgi:hypothetical protein